MFAEEIPLSAPTFSDEYLVVDRNNHPNDDWRRLSRWQPLISVDGWRDAVRVVGSTDTIVRDERFFLLDGQREPTYYWYKEIQSRGHRSAFERSTIKLADEFEAQFASGGMCPDKLSQYRKILEFAYEHGIEMHIILSPVHVWLLEVYYREGAWSILEAWKRALVRENARVAAQVGAPPEPLWDFSEYNEFTTEEIPPAGDTQTRMRWYWEVSHYRAELGEVVLDRVFGVDTVSVAGKEGFGVRITPKTMDEHLENVREQRERYAAAAQEELLFLDRHISRD